ncbi:MAG: hypothetical protein DRR11_19345, partial [Gammaproteobacteria bacterium]
MPNNEFGAGADRITMTLTKLLSDQRLTVILLMTTLALVITSALYVYLMESQSLILTILIFSTTGAAAIATFLAYQRAASLAAITARALELAAMDEITGDESTATIPATELNELLEQLGARLNTAEASAYQLDLLLDAMNDAVVLTDIDGNIIRL